MDVDLHLRYPAGPAEVAALLADAAFVEDLCAAGPALRWSVGVVGRADGAFTVTVERVLPTTDLPDAARRFVGEELTVVQVDDWAAPTADGTRAGTTRLDVVGAPLTASATSELAPATGGAEQVVRGRVRSSVPLLGGKLEKAAAPILERALREQEQLAAQRLAR